jgi:Fe-S-cluster containining protein
VCTPVPLVPELVLVREPEAPSELQAHLILWYLWLWLDTTTECIDQANEGVCRIHQAKPELVRSFFGVVVVELK